VQRASAESCSRGQCSLRDSGRTDAGRRCGIAARGTNTRRARQFKVDVRWASVNDGRGVVYFDNKTTQMRKWCAMANAFVLLAPRLVRSGVGCQPAFPVVLPGHDRFVRSGYHGPKHGPRECGSKVRQEEGPRSVRCARFGDPRYRVAIAAEARTPRPDPERWRVRVCHASLAAHGLGRSLLEKRASSDG
jgi:hypothetical protein